MSLLDSIGSSGGPSGLNNKLSIISKIVGFINNSNKSPRELAIGMMNNMDKNTSVQLKNFLHNAGISDSDLIKYDIKI